MPGPLPRPRVIVATHRPPLPLDNGSRIRSHRLLTGLAERCRVTLVTFDGGPTYDDTSTSRAELEASLPGVEIELVQYAGNGPRGGRRQVLHRSSDSFGHYASAGMTDALARLAAREPSVLHLEDPGSGLSALPVRAAVRSFAPHNIEHRILRDVAAGLGPVRRLALEVEWRKVRLEERRIHRAVDLSIAVSEIDAAEMRAQGARRVEVVPNGADPAEPAPWSAPAAHEPLRLLFVGTGNYWPYELGIAWFVRDVLPRLRADGPVQLDVVGAPPGDPVQAPDVVYHGRVPEVQSFYVRAHALVIPVFQGSGTRLKVVEAAQLGRPVISTAVGAEGLPVEPDRHYLRAEDSEGFAAAARALRTQPERVREISLAARSALEAFVWPSISVRLAELLGEALDQRTSTR